MKVLIVIPALNEEKALKGLGQELHEHAKKSAHELDFIVIDDGSTDRTAEVAREAGLRCVRLSRNLGIGGAVQTGLKIAQREGFDCAIQLDGDGQHPPSEIEILVPHIADADLVIGSRYLTKEGFQSTALRRFGAWWLAVLIRLISGFRVTDSTSGFRCYGRRALALYSASYPYDYPEPEALAMACAQRLKVREVSVDMRERQGGVSSIQMLHAGYYMVKVSIAILLSYFRNRVAREG